MSIAVVIGAVVGVGCLGVIHGLKSKTSTLEAVAAAMDRWPEPVTGGGRAGAAALMGPAATIGWIHRSPVLRERWRLLDPSFSITGESPERVVSRMLVLGGVGLLAPPALWLVGEVVGVTALPVDVAIVMALVAAAAGAALPLVGLVSRARARRHHVRIVLGSFVDLVVLNLAGGMGIESALASAAQVSSDWATRRVGRSLMQARESGQPSWVVLTRLGDEIGVSELVELAATLQLAGTEGTRIRQSLAARAVALRRHEQADAESAANRTTERLFLPGALLLLGFLLLVGFPAFSRVVGGFS